MGGMLPPSPGSSCPAEILCPCSSPAISGDLSAYTDAASVSAWAKDAMTWAVTTGIVKGVTETTLVPGANATRAQVATIMQRYAGL